MESAMATCDHAHELDQEEVAEKIPYTIHDWSSFSASYHPEKIAVENPNDQGSRWSSGVNNHLQFITIKLDRPAIVHSVLFGKYYKPHVCNLKEFKIFGGLTPDNMVELLHGGLANDNESEVFPVKHKANGAAFPLRYLRIKPISAHGANFNFSVWYVQVNGVADDQVVKRVMDDYERHREAEIIRLCLKHFRQRNYSEAFEALQRETQQTLEHASLTELHRHIVMNGDYDAAERIMEEACEAQLFNEHIRGLPYTLKWTRLVPLGADGQGAAARERPGMRGGHQMVLSQCTNSLVLVGGWDGANELGDMWVYSIDENRWRLLSARMEEQGGPSPRSCHRVCLDEERQLLYVLGRFVDPELRNPQTLRSDFYCYDLKTNVWERISSDTRAEGGPALIYDHQMCHDPLKNTLFVFGGRLVDPSHNPSSTSNPTPSNPDYSGLFMFDCATRKWHTVCHDNTPLPLASDYPTLSTSTAVDPAATTLTTSANRTPLKASIGHSMTFDSKSRLLYLFGGQREKLERADFHSLNVDTYELVSISRDTSKQNGPNPSYTHRMTLCEEKGEIYVQNGLVSDRHSGMSPMRNTIWVYSIRDDRWNNTICTSANDSNFNENADEPCPRFAHPLVLHPQTHTHYVFGGNPGDGTAQNNTTRLDDFWALKMVRDGQTEVLRACRFLIRKQRFLEMCRTNDSSALSYLQQSVSQTVNHSNAAESAQFALLSVALFDPSHRSESLFRLRTALYESLVTFFPGSYTQPTRNLTDFSIE